MNQTMTAGWWRRLWRCGLKGGLALVLGVLLPMQSSALAAPTAPVNPGGDQGKGKAQSTSRWPDQRQESAGAKIDKKVSDEFARSAKPVTYLVKMRAEADVFGAAKAARAKATPASKEITARSAVIKTLKDTAEASQRGLLSELAALKKKGSVLRAEPYWIANMIAVTSTKDVMERLAKRSDVARILPNSEIKLIKDTGPVRPAKSTSSQGGPVAMGDPGIQSVEWGIQRVGAHMVWSTYGIDGTGTVVASLDTGVDGDHPALQSKWRGLGDSNPAFSWFDAVNGQATPYDDHGHGTHTTGTMVGSDGANQIGVAPGARWIAAKILSGSGSGTSENIIRAGQWVMAPGGDPSKAPDVVNNSWGGGPGIDDWFRDIVRAWRAAEIFPSFAASNDGPGDGSVAVPGNYPESFAVGATDINDVLADFSGRGPSAYGVLKPQVSAPGVNVRSSVPGGGYEGGWNGTSMATPHVSGTVALLRSANAALTVEQIEQILMNSADPKTDSRYPSVPNNGFGHGILNAFTAVAMVVDGVGTVSGRVVTGGDDFEAPAVQHDPVAESYKNLPIDLSAEVTDNVATSNVQVRFRMPGMTWWGAADMTRTGGDHKNGTYTGSIPADITGGSAVEYYIQAMDHAGNMGYGGSAARPYSVQLLSGLQPPYSMDFEGAATGWTHGGTNDVWEIGEPTSGPGAAHSGAKVAATNLSGSYPDGSESYLISPPIDLSAGGAGTAFSFWHWYELEPGFDFGYVLGSGDGGNTWDVLGTFTGESGDWAQTTVDLTPYAGSASVYVAFYLSTDGSVNGAGWYIDDISMYADTEAPVAPTNLRAAADTVGGIALTWNAGSASDLSRYTVYRTTTSGSGYTNIGTAERPEFVDSTGTVGTTYYYAVTASDIFGNESPKSAEASATPVQGNNVFADDMESGDNGWTHSGAGDNWARGTPTNGPGAAHSGSNVWATSLSGNYSDDGDASLVSPPIILTGLSSISLRFAHWYSLERNYDFGHVEVSADGGTNWTALASYTSPGGSGAPVGWETPTLDLSSYAGQTIQVRFRLESDGSVNYPGWYIDDVMVAGATATGGAVNMPLSTAGVRLAASAKGKPSGPSAKQIRMPSRASTSAAPRTKSSAVKAGGIGIMSLPLDATVTVVETGRVVRTDPANGSFRMILPAGTYTLRAEAYGYFPADKTITVERDQEVSAIMVLSPIPKGTVTGLVTDARTGDPLAGAAVSVAEDLRVPPVLTGADGRYTLEVLQGTYTLEVRASGYYPVADTFTVAGGATETMDMWLEPFVGMPGEIAYDDGSAENAWGYYTAGNGWAVRMSPPAGQSVLLRGARIFLWDESWPSPGGNSFRAAVYEAKPDGTPGRLLGGPVRVPNGVRGEFNDVDFSSLGLVLNGDFFIAYIQDTDYPNTPGMAVDESSPKTDRNWALSSGNWAAWDGDGNFMIRALVDVEVGAPIIESPLDGTFTNNPNLTVTGTAAAGSMVTLSLDGSTDGTATADAAGIWSIPVTLTEGAHELSAVASAASGGTTTLPSAPVQITLDRTNPAIAIDSPADGHVQNTRVIQVSGRVTEANLRSLKVNGTEVAVASGGAFATEIVGAEGANTITVEAADHADNVSTASRSVMIDSVPPALTGMQPGANMTLYTGDSLTIAFDSEPGLPLAAFQVSLSGAATAGGKSTAGKSAGGSVTSLEPGEIAMREVRPGHYEGQWTLPDGVSSTGAHVQIRAVDAAGNEIRTTAPGTLRLIDNDRPVAAIRITPARGRANQLLTVDGKGSTDRDGRIVAWAWEFGDGTTGTGDRLSHRWTRPGTYTVRLTVTDDKGATGTATATVTITR
ncbi:MAG TPA: S8 family serine peptidase [Symbiobacteriaceae bacterium]|nr:S8 family serine peptidase [Symbiobacteriaceae bacterium]